MLLKVARVGTNLEDCFILETAFFDDMSAISEKLDGSRSVMRGEYDLVLYGIDFCSLCLKIVVFFCLTLVYCFLVCLVFSRGGPDFVDIPGEIFLIL